MIIFIDSVEYKFLNKIVYQEKVRKLGTLAEKKWSEAINKFDMALAPYHTIKMNE